MDLKVNTLQNMSTIRLKAVEVSLSYGKPGDPGGVKTHDMRFEGDAPAEQGWKVFQNDGEVQEYEYSVQYHFDPASGFDGKALSYSFGPVRTSDRTLLLNPHDRIGIAMVEVAANQVDWGQVTRIDVALQNGGRKKVVSLTREAPSATWKLRLDDPADRAISYAPSFVMKDRTVWPGGGRADRDDVGADRRSIPGRLRSATDPDP